MPELAALFVASRLTALASAYTVDIPVIIAAMGGVFTLLVMIAAAIAVIRAASLRATLEIQKASPESITQINDELRQAMAEQERSFNKQLGEEREKRAVLEGRIQALTNDFAHMLVEAVIRTAQNIPPFADHPPTSAGD